MGSEGQQPGRLRARRDFLAAAKKGRSSAMPGLILQSINRSDEATPRVGFTATKKLGGAVIRNRVRRRLREAARRVLPAAAKPGHDYVLIGRSATALRPFAELVKDLETALKRVHQRPHEMA
jgi:ribonuclease P protein component